MKLLTRILLTLCITSASALLGSKAMAFDFYRPVGAKGWGMGNTTVTFSDLWSVQNNQAGLGFIKQTSAGTYLENRFRLSNLNFGSVAAALPTKFGTFGININQFGYTAYHEQKFGLSFGRAFTEKFSFGFQMNYQLVRISEYSSAGAAAIEAGVIYKVSKQLHTGFHLSNPTLQKLGEPYNQSLPTVGKIGLAYFPSDKITLCVETQKEMETDAGIKLGAEYKAHSKLHIRAGYYSNPNTVTMGVGYNRGPLEVDIAASIQPVLGISPHAAISYRWAKKKK